MKLVLSKSNWPTHPGTINAVSSLFAFRQTFFLSFCIASHQKQFECGWNGIYSTSTWMMESFTYHRPRIWMNLDLLSSSWLFLTACSVVKVWPPSLVLHTPVAQFSSPRQQYPLQHSPCDVHSLSHNMRQASKLSLKNRKTHNVVTILISGIVSDIICSQLIIRWWSIWFTPVFYMFLDVVHRYVTDNMWPRHCELEQFPRIAWFYRNLNHMRIFHIAISKGHSVDPNMKPDNFHTVSYRLIFSERYMIISKKVKADFADNNGLSKNRAPAFS